ncbi:hypothetical protein JCM19236_5154 [Vibrio sp. JCM 19236]|nr:hypothetical protein JCM19236_5154 [Vibrio sp. JCM 19236]
MQSISLMKRQPNWVQALMDDEVLEVSGSELKHLGLTLTIQDPETCLLLHFQKL